MVFVPMQVDATATGTGRFAGQRLDLPSLGKVQLTRLFAQTTETAIYCTERSDIVVKVFDLECGNPEEVSYGPYTRFGLELANFEDIINKEALRRFVP